jgi:hypothetical protein
MKYPQRTDTHITETESWRLLQAVAPKEWIVRDVTERDYGIDAYIEIATPGGSITGNLVSIQLKGVDQINWKEADDGAKSRQATSPQIKTTTANYWLGLPVPVFLFVADLAERSVYFATVESQLRAQHEKLASQDKLTLKLHDAANLGSETGRKLFRMLVAREQLQPQFVFQVTTLLSSVQTFGDFILHNQGYDMFMEVDDDRHLQFRAIYDCLQTSALILQGNWQIESLNDLYKRDRQQWKDKYSFLHEATLDDVLKKLEAVFSSLVRKSLALVLEKQPDYWRRKDPAFYHLCNSGHAERAVTMFEEQSRLNRAR